MSLNVYNLWHSSMHFSEIIYRSTFHNKQTIVQTIAKYDNKIKVWSKLMKHSWNMYSLRLRYQTTQREFINPSQTSLVECAASTSLWPDFTR